jgi:hypothetical protein
MEPLKRTFAGVNAPSKPTFALIPCNFHVFSYDKEKNAGETGDQRSEVGRRCKILANITE